MPSAAATASAAGTAAAGPMRSSPRPAETTAPPRPEDRARLAEVLQAELDALTERIAVLERSREQLARFVDDVRGEVVGPLRPRPDVVPDVGRAVRRGAALPASRRAL